jgi:hypothetical protein
MLICLDGITSHEKWIFRKGPPLPRNVNDTWLKAVGEKVPGDDARHVEYERRQLGRRQTSDLSKYNKKHN